MTTYNQLVDGYKTYKTTVMEQKKDIVRHLIQLKIKPSTLFITCADLQISPEVITSAKPRDLYVIRNIGGIVPPYEKKGIHGEIAAIEFAVCELGVENIVVLGHTHCDGVIELMQHDLNKKKKSDPMEAWLNIGLDAKNAVVKQMGEFPFEDQCEACEKEILLVSIRNLLTYPWVKERAGKNQLGIYGWNYDIETGELFSYDPHTHQFELVL